MIDPYTRILDIVKCCTIELQHLNVISALILTCSDFSDFSDDSWSVIQTQGPVTRFRTIKASQHHFPWSVRQLFDDSEIAISHRCKNCILHLNSINVQLSMYVDTILKFVTSQITQITQRIDLKL